MNPDKVERDRLRVLTDLPNVGPSIARDLQRIGLHSPQALAGKDPVDMYNALCGVSGQRQDPCVLDVFTSITRFMDGGPARPWWAYTAERKKLKAQGDGRRRVTGGAG